jgi:hypothetical protein
MNAYDTYQHWIPEITDAMDEMLKYIQKTEYHFDFDKDNLVDSVLIRDYICLYILRIFGID